MHHDSMKWKKHHWKRRVSHLHNVKQLLTLTATLVFLDNFPMLFNSVVSIHCVARGLNASFWYKCPASCGCSLQQHGLRLLFRQYSCIVTDS